MKNHFMAHFAKYRHRRNIQTKVCCFFIAGSGIKKVLQKQLKSKRTL